MIGIFGRDKRKKGRIHADAPVVFTVCSGKDPALVSSAVAGIVKDFSIKGMSVVTPRIAPDGIHIMYDNLMVHKNRIDATVFPEGNLPIRVTGTVEWFRSAEDNQGNFIFGIQFDKEAIAETVFLPDRNPSPDR
ncbi:MAG: PilZ domain-containing protein [Syntrophorhabdaceae bacterium]|nr:PilZ domain-containing protein [Syntrophorhabdaceae bacterium]